MATIHLKPGQVQAIWAGHPWVYAQSVARVEGAPAQGDLVEVLDPRGKFIGRGFYSPSSAIPVRLLSRIRDDVIDDAWIEARIERAFGWRRDELSLPSAHTTGFRAVNSEGDGLPGLIVDVYGSTEGGGHTLAAVQLLTSGFKRREEAVFEALARRVGVKTVVEVASGRAQKNEGFESETRTVRGSDVDALRFSENGIEYELPVGTFQKTGFYFDQRENRARVAALSRDKVILDAFSYVGGFAHAAAHAGAARVVSLETSASAVAAAATIAVANGHSDRTEFQRADVKRALVEIHASGERFDLVIIDPPKLVPTARNLEAGRRAYRAVNTAASRLVKRGGILVTCSCSAAVTQSDFLRIVSAAVRDAGRDATLMSLSGAGPDHPVPPSFVEGMYLKCAILRLD